ncbi:MAG: ATP-binding protein [Vicinamibacterales bacterium]
MTEPVTVLTLRNDLSELPRITDAVEALAERHQLTSPTVMAVNLAIEEVFTNVVSYGFDEPGEHTIELALAVRDGSVLATVADGGRPHDPLQQDDPDVDVPLEERKIGGLGVMLVRELMDEVTYARRDGRNVLSMRKRVVAEG